MPRLTHYDYSEWFDSSHRTACNARGGDLTNHDPHVTCPKCLAALGYEIKEPSNVE